MIFDKKLDNLDFPAFAKNEFGIQAIEYVNQFFKDKAENTQYLKELKKRCEDNGVTSVLIMIDGEGNLGDNDETKRKQAVENHYKWVDAAKYLGCHSIRVNAAGKGTAEEVASAAIDGLGRLTEYGSKNDIGVIVENHGGYSSNGKWLSKVIKSVKNKNCGTLPDFGNFVINREKNIQYDKYKGVKQLMPFAKGVSAKSHNFDESGNESEIDFMKMMKIVKKSGYTGYVGIEYEGNKLSEVEGIKKTKALLEKIFKELT